MRIQGGTHLGIIGCFGERTFNTDDIEEVKKILLQDFDKKELPIGIATEVKSSSELEWLESNIHGVLGWSLFKKGDGRVIFEIAELDDKGNTKYKVRDLHKAQQEKLIKTEMRHV